MSTGKRLAKRSILGTRVCVPVGQDGRYYPAVILSAKSSSSNSSSSSGGGEPASGSERPDASHTNRKNGCTTGGSNIYYVMLDGAERTQEEYAEKELVGPGFQSVTDLQLVAGQNVFITHNGREVAAVVTAHPAGSDDVLLAVQQQPPQQQQSPQQQQQQANGPGSPAEPLVVAKRLEEVRLLESRKSARLLDQDQDYSRLADVGPSETTRGRRGSGLVSSSGIDVPRNNLKNIYNNAIVHLGNRKRRPSSSSEVDVLDDCSAAMVLMSLSCSPKSPRLPPYLNDAGGLFSRSWTETSTGSSSGSSSWQSSQSQRSTSTPSPPHSLSESAPSSIQGTTSLPPDEGIELDDAFTFLEDPLPRKRRNSTRTAFQCTWPGCKTVTRSCDAIEKHVRLVHLGRNGSDEMEHSDHEEEFYYTEVEISVDSMTDSFASMHTSSPPTLSHMDMARPPYEDPEYQKTLQLSPMKLSKVGIRIPSSSPKPSPLRHRKCRKVYGMENRDLWCTQCKWKKACTRFSDVSLPPI